MKCIIIEDEEPAQRILQNYIDKTPNVECLGIFDDVIELPFTMIKEVDFIFLDIQLPEISGFSFLKKLEFKPKVIITTAYREYAIEAFEEAVLDYMLKPFSYSRFIKSVLRVQNSIGNEVNNFKDNEIFVYADKTYHHINISAIAIIKAEVDYVKIILNDKSILVKDSLTNWNIKLSGFRFIRVHRSFLININKIDKIIGNRLYINDRVVPIGQTYKNEVINLIKNL